MNLKQKIDIFTQRLAREPHSRVFAPLADLLRQAGQLEDALDLLEDGLGRHPDYVSALVIKGRTLLEAGRLDLARQVLNQVLELDPENFVVLRLLTEDARSRQAWEESIPLLEKLVVLDSDDDRWPGALAEAKQFAARVSSAGSAGSSFATMTLVDIYLAQGYRAKALAALDQMAAREPDRQDILRRITEIKAEGPSALGGLGSRIPSVRPPEEQSAANGKGRADRRSGEKKQFEEWIDRIRPGWGIVVVTGRVVVIGGPNLGRLGSRQPEIYGETTWAELESLCHGWAVDCGLEIDFLQSDLEGELIRMIHGAGDAADGLILNAAAYTHTSVAIRDAVAAVDIPVVEIHLTNPDARESFRRNNLLADVVTAGIRGFGIEGYRLALVGLAALLKAGQAG